MLHFPVFLDLQGRVALVLGTGEVAERKAALLRQAGAEIRFAERFAPALLEGCAIAIGADAAEPELQALAAACRARGLPVNVVDRPALCTALMPAIIDRAPMTIAVSSGGAAPVLARQVRQRIEAAVPLGLGRVAAMAERFKAAVRRRLPDLAARRRFLDAALAGPAADLAMAGREAEADAAFAAALDGAETRPPGLVHLVGAGPGAGDLLTLRALRLLGEADVIVHDRLGTEEVLELARRDAERIFVGKARANHCMKQEEINALLIRLAREGKRVVRLKGGDPLIFGRGGEEAEALAAAGIACEVVPGVTAALACAAGAGIPLTHREAARAVTFVTGHRRDGGVDVSGLVRPGQTLAIYMGIAMLPAIRDGLVADGLDPATPAAVIERGGTARQRVLRGTLAEIAAAAPGWVEGGPALLLIGAAVGRGADRGGAALAA
ncbi:siroheme synthase CysG [Roseicella frigidaeris]|uniref:Uroporphyrinogen-III C-methyltransferase n=1 Tax=Roseicella frigidaeris TaxID=2230885 RepID=A0A327M1C6_9PROT|nr:siroheme synthase CysG [Roseicella frigidaeris]RAI56164.1 uroporphyrinogen-III C-methyltransferase [Roseicella frigidaeris]